MYEIYTFEISKVYYDYSVNIILIINKFLMTNFKLLIDGIFTFLEIVLQKRIKLLLRKVNPKINLN